MRILEVSRFKTNYADNQLPFVTEQGEAIAQELRKSQVYGVKCNVYSEPSTVEYFLVKGNYIKAVGALKKKIREFKPDIVHAHYGLSAITAELQGLVPVVTTFHNGETLNPMVNFASSLMSLRAKHVIYVAQHIRDLSYFKAKNYSIIPCGVPMDQCVVMDKAEARKKLGWSDDKKYILFGGAFDNLRKNYALLRDAVELLEKENNTENSEENIKENCSKPKMNNPQSLDNDSQLIAPQSASEISVLPHEAQTIISRQSDDQLLAANALPDDSEKNDSILESQKNTKNIEIVEMKGLSRKDCVLRMNACDLFALPSHSEGSPQALKEAMACNCPCLATDIADVKYLFGDEPGHWILRNPRKTHERWDGDEKSLDEMVQLLNEALMYEGRTNGRKRILDLELSNEQVAKRIIKIYEEILSV